MISLSQLVIPVASVVAQISPDWRFHCFWPLQRTWGGSRSGRGRRGSAQINKCHSRYIWVVNPYLVRIVNLVWGNSTVVPQWKHKKINRVDHFESSTFQDRSQVSMPCREPETYQFLPSLRRTSPGISTSHLIKWFFFQWAHRVQPQPRFSGPGRLGASGCQCKFVGLEKFCNAWHSKNKLTSTKTN